jgi:hypothetical protein
MVEMRLDILFDQTNLFNAVDVAYFYVQAVSVNYVNLPIRNTCSSGEKHDSLQHTARAIPTPKANEFSDMTRICILLQGLDCIIRTRGILVDLRGQLTSLQPQISQARLLQQHRARTRAKRDTIDSPTIA